MKILKFRAYILDNKLRKLQRKFEMLHKKKTKKKTDINLKGEFTQKWKFCH